MKTLMKTLLLMLTCIICTTSIYAQSQISRYASKLLEQKQEPRTLKTKLGLVGGVNFTNMRLNGENVGNKSKIGFQVGSTIEVPINNRLSFASGIIASNKGIYSQEEMNFFGTTLEMEQTISLYYIDIPLTAKIYFDVKGIQCYSIIGPYVSAGVAGYSTLKVSAMGKSEKETESVNMDDIGRFDAGLIGGLGVTNNRVSLGFSSQHGFVNDLQNSVFAISMGYQFGK